MVFVFSNYINSDFLEMAGQLPVHGKWWMHYLFYFSLLIKLSLSQSITFLIFTLVIFSTIPVWRKWENLYGACWLQLNHYKLFKNVRKLISYTELLSYRQQRTWNLKICLSFQANTKDLVSISKSEWKKQHKNILLIMKLCLCSKIQNHLLNET